jgi:hypothetical protein
MIDIHSRPRPAEPAASPCFAAGQTPNGGCRTSGANGRAGGRRLAPETANRGQRPVAQPATLLGRADIERRSFLAAAVYTACDVTMPLHYDHEPVARLLRARTGHARVGVSEIAVIRQITKAFGAADEILGGGHGLPTVAAYLADTAAPMLSGRFANDKTRRDAFSAAAELRGGLLFAHFCTEVYDHVLCRLKAPDWPSASPNSPPPSISSAQRTVGDIVRARIPAA